MLPFDILAADNHVYSFEPSSLLTHRERFSKGTPQNDWEQALVYIQENDAPQALPTLCNIPEHTIILRYCAAHVLLAKRAHLLNPDRIDYWYVLLDERQAFSNFDAPDFYPHSLGRLRTLYGIEWLHARAMRYTPLQHAWFAGHYWPTLWSGSNPSPIENQTAYEHNIERWSFLQNQWHIQHWICEENEGPTPWPPYSRYTSQIASPISIELALERTLLHDRDTRLQAWNSIPTRLRASCLLDWALSDSLHHDIILPYLSEQLGVRQQDVSIRLDLARTLESSGATILQSLTNGCEMWALPQD